MNRISRDWSRWAIALLIASGVAVVGFETAPGAQTSDDPLPLAIKGISYFSFRENTFGDSTQDPVWRYIESSGANWVSLSTMFFWNPQTQSIGSRPGWTDWRTLPVALARAKARGLKTALYVFVRTEANEGFAVTPPSDIDEFFRHYANLLSGYADLAQREGVDLLIIGNEMNSITGPPFRERWLNLIEDVRRRYSGRLSYNAFPNVYISNVTLNDVNNLVSFWDKLDLIGFSIYPQLAASPIPDRQEIERGWTASFYTGSNLLKNLKRWHELTSKKIFFAEIGYYSADGAAINSGTPPNGVGTPNNALQALLYDVMFEQVAAEAGPWLEGMFLWTLNTWNKQNDPFQRQIYVDLDYTFLDKPAAEVIRRWYSTGPRPAVNWP